MFKPLLALVAAAIPISAHAAIVQRSFSLTAGDFFSPFPNGEPLPVDQFRFDFSLSFDDAAEVPGDDFGSSNGLNIKLLNLSNPATVKFVYSKAFSYIAIGHSVHANAFGVGCNAGQGEFCVSMLVKGAGTGNPAFSPTRYSTMLAGERIYWLSRSNTLIVSAVPEPATWAMMIGGLALAGTAARRRNRSAPVAA